MLLLLLHVLAYMAIIIMCDSRSRQS